MEILLLIVIVWATKGAWDHAKGARTASRDQRIAEVAKTYPKGVLPKSRQKAAARQHAAGWWAREVRHGFPVTKTGWHAAWLAHQTVADHHKARREEARTTALETRASVLKGMPDHKKRQAEAQAELDKIRGELAAQQAKGSPATGRKAVQEAADEVARKRAEKEQPGTGKCPACGAPDGYEHLEGCDPAAPPLPAESVRRSDPVVIDTPVRLHNAEDSAHLRPGEPRCEGCGGTGRNGTGDDACPVCRGWGAAAVGPEFMSPAPAGTVCNACGRKGSAADPVLIAPGGTTTHRSHAAQQHEAYAGALKRLYPDDGEIDDAVTGADHGFEGEYDPGAGASRNPQPLDAPEHVPGQYEPGDDPWAITQAGTMELNGGHLIMDGWGFTDPHLDPADGPFPNADSSGGADILKGHSLAELHGMAHGASCRCPISRARYAPGPETVHRPPTTQGAPVTADTNYTTVLTNAKGFAAQADEDAVTARSRRMLAEHHLEEMQAAEVDGATLSSQMDLVERLRASEEAAQAIGEHATAVSDGLQQRHGGLKQAHDDAPVRAAVRDFYEGS